MVRPKPKHPLHQVVLALCRNYYSIPLQIPLITKIKLSKLKIYKNNIVMKIDFCKLLKFHIDSGNKCNHSFVNYNTIYYN